MVVGKFDKSYFDNFYFQIPVVVFNKIHIEGVCGFLAVFFGAVCLYLA